MLLKKGDTIQIVYGDEPTNVKIKEIFYDVDELFVKYSLGVINQVDSLESFKEKISRVQRFYSRKQLDSTEI